MDESVFVTNKTKQESKNKGKIQMKRLLLDSAPLIGLLGLIVTYVTVLNGNVTVFNIEIIINQSVILATIATGAVFIFSIGGFDISLGAAMAVSAMMGIVAYNNTESLIMTVLVCILVGLAVGTMNSLLSAILNIPAFVATIAMLSILNALMNIILDGNSNIVMASSALSQFDTPLVKIAILISYFAIAFYLFNKTGIGRKNKFLGSNPIAASQTGISIVRQTMYSFIFSGLGVGLAAFLTLLRVSTLSSTTGASIGMDVLVAIVFGGMLVSGGAKSKITASLIGTVSITLLNQILLIVGASFGATQLIKGIVFLVVVYIATSNSRTKLLPR